MTVKRLEKSKQLNVSLLSVMSCRVSLQTKDNGEGDMILSFCLVIVCI